MIFGYFTLFVALIISAVAEFYSIVGLTAIFSAAFWPIVIMGAVLGVGKITAAVWLKLNWERASWTYKFYLVPAVAFLMLLTSMGIFGFLSKAHSDQSLVSGDAVAKVAIYDEKINTAKDNIAMARKALKQMDDAVDQVMGRSADEKGADKAVAIRRGQAKERARLLAEIESEQRNVAKLSEERAPLAAEFRKVESEVGPIKYIAALVYGDNPDANILEKAVRLVIIIIVAVFDPLALVLILAAQQSLRWYKEEKEVTEQKEEDTPVEVNKHTQTGGTDHAALAPVVDAAGELPAQDPHEVGWMFDPNKHKYLTEPFVHFKNVAPMVAPKEQEVVFNIVNPEEHYPEIYAGNPDDFKEPWSNEDKANLVEAMKSFFDSNKEASNDGVDEEQFLKDFDANLAAGHETESPILTLGIDEVERPGDYITPPEETSKFPKVPETANRIKEPAPYVPPTLNINKVGLQADNIEGAASHSDFGTKFPDGAVKGHMFLRVDYLPNKLFKFNGTKWIEVDKSKTDSYTYDEQYILFLIEKLKSGEYDLDQLSASEQELVAEKLKQLTNDQNT